MLDAAERVLERVERGRAALGLALGRQADLELLQGLHELLLGLHACRLVTAAAAGAGGVALRAAPAQ